MTDVLLQKFFEIDRWEKALETGVGKGIDKGELRRLTSPEVRAAMYKCIVSGNYEIAPPHQAEIPKDDGTMRIVYVNENVDRVFLSIVNDMLFELFPEMIHKSCKSYQSGIGCGKVVQEVSRHLCNTAGTIIGWKSDLSKYFDTVPIEFIDRVFEQIEEKVGKSKIINIVRKYYHTDWCFDVEGNLIEHYQSLKQGCAVASFLADTMLYHIDERLSTMDGYYVRYSDDCLYIGADYERAMELMKMYLGQMRLTLNPKKIEYLTHDKWFKFLGFSICGDKITLSKGRIKSFQKEIQDRTVNNRKNTPTKAINQVNRYLYKGDGQFSWASSVLPIINVQHDIKEMNEFVIDCIRGVMTGKGKTGGLGYVNDQPEGVIVRGIGQNVKANRQKTPKEIEGYFSIQCMRNAILYHRAVYDTLVRSI